MPVLEVTLDPNEDDRKAILDPLLAFNDLKAGDDHYQPLAIFLRDDEGEIRGGLGRNAIITGCSSSYFSCPKS